MAILVYEVSSVILLEIAVSIQFKFNSFHFNGETLVQKDTGTLN